MEKEYILGIKGIKDVLTCTRVVLFHLERASGKFRYIGIPKMGAEGYREDLEENSEVIGLNYCYDKGLYNKEGIEGIKEFYGSLERTIVSVDNKATKVLSGSQVKEGTALYSIVVNKDEFREEDMYYADARLVLDKVTSELNVEMNQLCHIKSGKEMPLLNNGNIIFNSKYGKFIEDTFEINKLIEEHKTIREAV